MRYDVFLHADLLGQMPKTGEPRRRIMSFILSLHEAPFTAGDFTDRDATQRDREVKVIGDYAVTYWVDAAVRAVMIVDIRRADR